MVYAVPMPNLDLTWAWPDGLALDVVDERSVASTDHRGDRVYRSRNTYRMTWKAGAIRITDHQRHVLAPDPVPPGTFDHQRVVRFVEECGPSFTVDADGQVGELLPEVAAQIKAAVEPPLALKAAIPAAAGLVARISTPDAVRTAAQALWNTIVGGFAGGSVPDHGSVRAPLDVPIAVIGGHPVRHAVELTLNERRPDGRVRLTAEAIPDPTAIARVLEALVAPGLGGVRVERMAQVTRTELDTDPATLVPERATVERRTTMTVRAPPGAPQPEVHAESVEVRTWTFTRVAPAEAADAAADADLAPEHRALLTLLASRGADPDVYEAVSRQCAPPLPPALVDAVRARIARSERQIGWEGRSEVRGARLLAERLADPRGVPLAPCPWGDRVRAWVCARPDAEQWIALLCHAVNVAGKTRPTRAWSAEGARLVAAVGVDAFRERVRAWCDATPAAEMHGVRAGGDLRPTNGELLRGLLFLVAPEADAACVDAIERLALVAWQKVAFGPRAPHLGVGALAALTTAPKALATPAFRRLDPQIAYERARREIDRALR